MLDTNQDKAKIEAQLQKFILPSGLESSKLFQANFIQANEIVTKYFSLLGVQSRLSGGGSQGDSSSDMFDYELASMEDTLSSLNIRFYLNMIQQQMMHLLKLLITSTHLRQMLEIEQKQHGHIYKSFWRQAKIVVVSMDFETTLVEVSIKARNWIDYCSTTEFFIENQNLDSDELRSYKYVLAGGVHRLKALMSSLEALENRRSQDFKDLQNSRIGSENTRDKQMEVSSLAIYYNDSCVANNENYFKWQSEIDDRHAKLQDQSNDNKPCQVSKLFLSDLLCLTKELGKLGKVWKEKVVLNMEACCLATHTIVQQKREIIEGAQKKRLREICADATRLFVMLKNEIRSEIQRQKPEYASKFALGMPE